jgi:hypothetical protein
MKIPALTVGIFYFHLGSCHHEPIVTQIESQSKTAHGINVVREDSNHGVLRTAASLPDD